ncbi:hypothetical protein [Natronococcus occultus]|uniref:Uncharacterized protein n=1 Tax=Natronococcus occultus SP4 TaxID=694430 RepID=L0K3I4_9EURY|nr:hypothetical protein [Natronococcus occultus]AGB38904.1 hypothetical protein Natoc_3164 [Natronococcus occultus SP4]
MMAVAKSLSRTGSIAGIVVVSFVALAYFGVQYILAQGWGLIFEVTYLLVLLIVFAIVSDRLFIR